MVSKVTKKLNLRQFEGYTDLTPSEKAEVKREVGDLIKESILLDVGEARSPVTGKAFKGLTKEYKKRKGKISSSRVANMELTGDMLDSLKWEAYRDGVEVGIFNETEAQKADNHNKFSAKSRKTPVPERPFIPRKDANFRKDIMDGVRDIIKDISGES